MLKRILGVFTLCALGLGAPTSLTLQNCTALNAQLISAASKGDKKKVIRVIGLRDSSTDGQVSVTNKEMDALLRTIGKLENQTVIGHAIDRFDGLKSPRKNLPLNAEEEGKRLQRVKNTVKGIKIGSGVLALGLGLWFFGPAVYDTVIPILEDEDETLFRRNRKLLAKKYNFEVEDDLYDDIDRISGSDRRDFLTAMRELNAFLTQESLTPRKHSKELPARLKKVKFDRSYSSLYKTPFEFETDDDGDFVVELNQFTTMEHYKKLLTSDRSGLPNLVFEDEFIADHLQEVMKKGVPTFEYVWDFPKNDDITPDEATRLGQTTSTLLKLFEEGNPTMNFKYLRFQNEKKSHEKYETLYLNYTEKPEEWLHFFGTNAESDK